MPLSDLAAIREWVGSTPDDTTLLVLLEDHGGDVKRTALGVLRTRYADMISNPTKWATVDDYSEDWSENLRVLRAQVVRLEDEVEGEAATGGYAFQSVAIAGPGSNR
jgi:hypothetical protein